MTNREMVGSMRGEEACEHGVSYDEFCAECQAEQVELYMEILEEVR